MHTGVMLSSCRPSRDQKALKEILNGNYGLLSPKEKRMASTLVAAGQQHLFQHWPAPGMSAGFGFGIHKTLSGNCTTWQVWRCVWALSPLYHPAGIKDAKKRALLSRLAAEFSTTANRIETSRTDVLQAPKVVKRPYTVIGSNGEKREDPYYWLRDDERENAEVIEHLKVGKAVAFHGSYTAAVTEVSLQCLFGMRIGIAKLQPASQQRQA